MPSLREIFEASVATRLAGHSPAQDLGRYKAFLKVESHRLQMHHRAGARGREVCRDRSLLVDVLIRHLWETAKQSMSEQAQQEFPPMVLVALGGYGRAELSPLSDIDIMFLHQGQVVVSTKPLPWLSRLMDGILTPLWDLGFKVGHSVRTIAECAEAASNKSDPRSMESKTALIEARWVAGDEKLFERFRKAIVARCVEGHEEEYIAARIKDQSERRTKFGNSATMQEPNIKNGCGGLRDYQSLHWMAFFKYRTRSLAEMEERGFITEAERKPLDKAYDFLLRVRNEMHYLAGSPKHPVDTLTKALQPTVATHLGYTERSPSRRLEKFMRDLYNHMRNIFLITRVLEERLALLPRPQLLPDFRKLGRLLPTPFRRNPPQVVDGFRFADGHVHLASPRAFKDQPRRLMRVFLHAQQRGLKLHPDLAQAIRRELPLVGRGFLYDEHVRESFLEILNQRGNVAPILRAMHEVGLLGRYVPEFGKLTCLVQHEFYHQYTADEHTLMCLAQLDRVWEASDPMLTRYAELLHAVERPFILYLALLLHDAGKALDDKSHSEAGARLAGRVAKRLALDGATTHSLRILIEHHLSMAMISQRRDLEDPGVIRHFAGLIQTQENLRMLALHTVTDSMATSDKLWNGFKDSLLWELYDKTSTLLMGGTDFIRAEEKQRELLAEEVRGLMPRTFHRDELDAHFSVLPSRYFQVHSAREVFTDLALAHRFMHQQIEEEETALQPVLHWHNEPDRGYTTCKVCTWDRSGLFSTLAGSYSAAGINILSAQIFSREDGIVLDTFYVTDGSAGGVVHQKARDKFESILNRALASEGLDLGALIARQVSARPLYQSLPGERIPTRIFFDNDASENRTVIDLETEDHLGLLYIASKVLAEVGLDIALAKISTEKGAAIDSFYVSELDGQKVLRPERQKYIAERLMQALTVLSR
ncbi:MAG TPA: [protein-PII] uridylyltransferase [Verrucomicrobiae bacterium]|nr:[protein-PII] uridylyltransferase [Verrucomicrobiae bacterium]